MSNNEILSEVSGRCYEVPYLENDQIILKKISVGDAPNIKKMVENINVQKYLPAFIIEKESESIEDAIKLMYDTYYKNKQSLHLGIYLKDDPKNLVGITEIFHYQPDQKQVSIGFRIDESNWGKGIATNVTKLVINYLFNQTGIEKISASVIVGNVGSERALIKNGFNIYKENVEEDWGREIPVIVNKYMIEKTKGTK